MTHEDRKQALKAELMERMNSEAHTAQSSEAWARNVMSVLVDFTAEKLAEIEPQGNIWRADLTK